MRQPKQILAIPFLIINNELRVVVLKKKRAGYWQFISGGCENNEIEYRTVIREVEEETGIKEIFSLYQLETTNSIPANAFSSGQRSTWSNNILIIPEIVFAYRMNDSKIKLNDYPYIVR